MNPSVPSGNNDPQTSKRKKVARALLVCTLARVFHSLFFIIPMQHETRRKEEEERKLADPQEEEEALIGTLQPHRHPSP